MKKLKRQDKQGVRTPTDLERRYRLNDIELTKEELEYLKTLIVVDESLSTTSTNPVQNKVITQVLNNKVNKETGKGLSSNDFTDEEKSKLSSISNNAEENTIESISVNGVPQTITNKNVNIQISSEAAEYSYYIVTTGSITTIPITEEHYSSGDIVNVYINGMKLIKDLHFSISENNIVLTNGIDVIGTEIEIIIKKVNS